MSSQLDDPELVEPRGLAVPKHWGLPDPEEDGGAHRLAPARGIILGLLIAIPLWSLLAFTVYILI